MTGSDNGSDNSSESAPDSRYINGLAAKKTTATPVKVVELERNQPEDSPPNQYLSDSSCSAESESNSTELVTNSQAPQESGESGTLLSEVRLSESGAISAAFISEYIDSAQIDSLQVESNSSKQLSPAVLEFENSEASSQTLRQHHVSHILSEVLDDDDDGLSLIRGLRFPMVLDCLLAVALLIAVGGFTIGLFQMYLIHSASQSISEQRYKAAIAILKGAPMPQVFARPGSDTEELLSRARYLDAMDKLESGTDTELAVKELGEIHPGSRYFALAQEAINENTAPASIMLQGGAETTESAPVIEKKPSLLENALREEEHR